MGMTRQERIASHKKQERLQVKSGKPDVSELTEGVPVIRSTPEGVVEYVKYNGVLYKKILDRADISSDAANVLDLVGADNVQSSSHISFQDGSGLQSQAFQIVNDTDNNMLDIFGDLSGGFDRILRIGRANGDIYMPEVYSDSSAYGRDLYIQSTGQLTYKTSSRVFKENITALSDDSIINSLRPVSFTAKGSSEIQYGLIAEEVWDVDENLCIKALDKEKLEYNLETDAIGVDYDALIPVLIKGVQELSAKIDIMQEEINNLKSS